MSILKVVLQNHDTTSDLYPKSDAEIIDYTDLNDNLMSVKKFLDSLKQLMSKEFTGELDNLVDVLGTLGDKYDSLLAIANTLKDFLEGDSTTEAIDNWKDLINLLDGLKDGDNLKDMIDSAGDSASGAQDTADAAYNQANAAYDAANAALDSADGALSTADVAYNLANAAYNRANDAYNAANDASDLALRAYNQANLAYTLANNAYSAANSANTLATTANTTATSAYSLANAAYNAANDKLPLAGGTMTGNIVLGTSQGRIFPNGAIKLDSGIILY